MRPARGTPDGLSIAEEILSAKWNVRIMRVLSAGPVRFSGIRAAVPDISANILAGRLRYLEKKEIVRRTILPPPAGCQVYDLTEIGEASRPILTAIDGWAKLLEGRER